jgi:hypothetical protein
VEEPSIPSLRLSGTPTRVHRLDGFGSLHAASYAAVRTVMPTDRLRPLRLPDGRATIMISALHKREWTVADGPYADGSGRPWGEVIMASLIGRPFAGRLRDLAALATGRFGLFVLHLAMTTREACDAARVGWGQPAFVADIAFEDLGDEAAVRVSDDGGPILALTIRRGGVHRTNRRPQVFYAAAAGQLLRTVFSPSVAHQQQLMGRRLGELSPGTDHPVAVALGRLAIDPQPLATVSVLAGSVTLNPPVRVGPAGAIDGYAGDDREMGRYTVRYPGTGPIDQYRHPWPAA